MPRRGKFAALCSTSSTSGEFCLQSRCPITCTFSRHQSAGMCPLAISQNGLNAGSTKRIGLRIAGRLCQRAPRRIGDGRRVVSIAYCDLMNPSRKNGNTFAKTPCALAWWSIQKTGRISFNSMPRRIWRLTQTPYNSERVGVSTSVRSIRHAIIIAAFPAGSTESKGQAFGTSASTTARAVHDLSSLPRRLVRHGMVQFCRCFNDLGLQHWHDVGHVCAEFLHRGFSDRRAIKISQRL
jgi:hypothetical protein